MTYFKYVISSSSNLVCVSIYSSPVLLKDLYEEKYKTLEDFSKVLYFSSCKSHSFRVKITSRYFIFFVYIFVYLGTLYFLYDERETKSLFHHIFLFLIKRNGLKCVYNLISSSWIQHCFPFPLSGDIQLTLLISVSF